MIPEDKNIFSSHLNTGSLSWGHYTKGAGGNQSGDSIFVKKKLQPLALMLLDNTNDHTRMREAERMTQKMEPGK